MEEGCNYWRRYEYRNRPSTDEKRLIDRVGETSQEERGYRGKERNPRMDLLTDIASHCGIFGNE